MQFLRTIVLSGGRRLEVVTVMEPASQFMKLALTAQEFCNLGRDLKGLARHVPPWEPGKLDAYPIRKQVLDLTLRCLAPAALAWANLLGPVTGMAEVCIVEQAAVFCDFFGKSLVVQSTADASLFGGKGGEYGAVQRVHTSAAVSVTDRTWDPATYLTD